MRSGHTLRVRRLVRHIENAMPRLHGLLWPGLCVVAAAGAVTVWALLAMTESTPEGESAALAGRTLPESLTVAQAERLVHTAQASEAPLAEVDAWTALALACRRSDAPEAARDALRQGQARLADSTLPDGAQAIRLVRMGGVAELLGEHADASALYRRGAILAERAGRLRVAAYAERRRAAGFAHRQEWVEAAAGFRQALALTERAPHASAAMQRALLASAAHCALQADQPEAALAIVRAHKGAGDAASNQAWRNALLALAQARRGACEPALSMMTHERSLLHATVAATAGSASHQRLIRIRDHEGTGAIPHPLETMLDAAAICAPGGGRQGLEVARHLDEQAQRAATRLQPEDADALRRRTLALRARTAAAHGETAEALRAQLALRALSSETSALSVRPAGAGEARFTMLTDRSERLMTTLGLAAGLSDSKPLRDADMEAGAGTFGAAAIRLVFGWWLTERVLPEAAALGDATAVARLTRALPKGEAAVFFARGRGVGELGDATSGGPRLFAFVLTSGAQVRCLDLGPVARLVKALEAWRKHAGRVGVAGSLAEVECYTLLYAPLRAAVSGTRAFWIGPTDPAGAMAAEFDFAALPTPEGGRLGERIPFRRLNREDVKAVLAGEVASVTAFAAEAQPGAVAAAAPAEPLDAPAPDGQSLGFW